MKKYSPSVESARTGIHRRVERLLDSINVSYESEAWFKPRHVDIYITEWHLAIEVDGPFHQATVDQRRDAELLEQYGLPTYRIKLAAESKKNAEILQDIVAFIELHADTAKERLAIWQMKPLRG